MNSRVKHTSTVLVTAMALIFGGCATRVDLYDYRDVSSVNVVDLKKADYRVEPPKLNSNIEVTSYTKRGYNDYIRDAFMSENSKRRVFDLNGASKSHHLALSLHNLEYSREYHPSRYVKTDKGGYYTKAYWHYTFMCTIGARLLKPDGDWLNFEADQAYGFRVKAESSRGGSISRDKYLDVIRSTVKELFEKIANSVAPEGLVISKKVNVEDDEDYIFLVNMGYLDGLAPEQMVFLYKSLWFKNEIDATTVMQKIFIGKATVSDQVTAHQAWIVMNDRDANVKVDVGDVIRARYR